MSGRQAFKCEICSEMFTRPDSLRRHESLIHSASAVRQKMYQCTFCSMKTAYKKSVIRHLKSIHNIEDPVLRITNADSCMGTNKSNEQIEHQRQGGKKNKTNTTTFCSTCNLDIPAERFTSHSRSLSHKKNSCEVIERGICLIKSAFKGNIASYRISYDNELDSVHRETDFATFFSKIKEKVLKLIRAALSSSPLKVNFELFGLYAISTKTEAEEGENEIKNEIKSFNSKYEIVTITTELDDLYGNFCDVLKTKAEEFQACDSGWFLVTLLYLELNLVKFNPLRASSYMPLPNDIQRRRAIVNVENGDWECFKWACLSALHPPQFKPNRLTHYLPYSNELNFNGISFPVKLGDIAKFEKLNNISINVFGLERNKSGASYHYSVVGPLYHTKERKETHINLLYFESENHSGNGHFCWIKSMSRLIGMQMSKHEHAIFVCDGCLVVFQNKNKLKEHLRRGDCSKVCTILPNIGEQFLEFKDFHKSLPLPFVIYADFETLLKPIQKCESDPEKRYTVDTHRHEAFSFAYYIKCYFDNSISLLRQYRGTDCTSVFVKWLIEDTHRIYKTYFKNPIAMLPLTAEQMERHETATNCFICGDPFTYTSTDDNDDDDMGKDAMAKVKDHDHFTGLYRGPAHKSCNLNYKTPNFIPIFLHNSSNYDLHLLVQELAVHIKDIDVIPLNKEKYISLSAKIWIDGRDPDNDISLTDITEDDGDDTTEYDEERINMKRKQGHRKNNFINLRFLDSFRFMACSLDTLAKNLQLHQFTETRKAYPKEEMFNLVTRKGAFPYEFVDSYEKLLSTHELPQREQFYSSLTESNIDEEDYEHAKMVWKTFKCRNLADYSDLYLKTDVLLLTDIFESFRKVCKDIYDLDPCHFFTLPGLSWNAMMKYTKIKLELLTDIDMLHFIRKSIRGGIVQCTHRHAVANNPYMPERSQDDEFNYLSYKPDADKSFLIYLDANNLYGFALSQTLPYGGFQWLTPEEISNFNIMSECSNPNSEIGYILEVDLVYPQELHDLHNEFPFCPENIRPPNKTSRQIKLIPNLFDKNNYVIHYRNLYQAIQHGLHVKKIHRILSFRQSAWLKKYVDLNTKMRQQATNEFEKNSYKLANNAIFGKCMEAVDKRVNVKLLTSWKNYKRRRGAESLISSPSFHSVSIFNENFVAIQLKQMKVNFNKPIYVGFSVLDISKTVMYAFHYDFIKRKYGNDNAQLLYTDTDSLLYRIKTDDIYVDIKRNIEKFDTSNYEADNVYGLPLVNKAVPGVFKDENSGKIMLEFVGLRAKLYDFVVENRTVIKKAKGVKKCVTKRLKHEAYQNCLFNKTVLLCKQNIFRSIKHVIYTQTVNKVALSAADDKRYILPDGISTLAWGNFRIRDMGLYS